MGGIVPDFIVWLGDKFKIWQVKRQGQFSIRENLVEGQRINPTVKVRQVQRSRPQTPGSS